jgi:ribonuclease P protein component
MLRLITKHKEYLEFRNPDLFLRTSHFNVPVIVSPFEFAVGITIGKKIGKAHIRNKLKRRNKAWFHHHKNELPSGIKLKLNALPGAGELNWTQLCEELNELTQRLS